MPKLTRQTDYSGSSKINPAGAKHDDCSIAPRPSPPAIDGGVLASLGRNDVSPAALPGIYAGRRSVNTGYEC